MITVGRNSTKTKVMFTRIRIHGVPLFLVTLFILMAYPAWLLPGQYGLDDLSNLNAPQRMLLAWFFHNGHLPLWNPFNFGGQPFLSAGQSGPLYFPNIVYLLLPIGQAIKVSYLFHELLCAYGMYALVYHLSRSRMGGMVGSLTFATCGFFIGHQVHTQMFDAFSWLPMCFWLLLRLLSRGTYASMTFFAGSLALEVFAGHPQMTFYILLALGLYLCCFLLQDMSKASFLLVLKAVLSIFLGLALSAVQWVSTADFVTYSDRAHVDPSFLLAGSMPPDAAAQFLTPFAAGGGYVNSLFSAERFSSVYHAQLYWEFLCYVGLVALSVALTTAISEFRRVRFIQIFSVIALLGLSLAFGGYSGLHSILTNVPGFDFFRIPSRYIGLTDFCLSVLAGVGIGKLRTRLVSPSWWVIFPCTSFALLACIVVVSRFGPFRNSAANTVWVPSIVLVVLGGLSLYPTLRKYWANILTVTALVDVTYQCMVLSPFVLSSTPYYSAPSSIVTYLQKHLPKNAAFTRVAVLSSNDLSHDRLAGFQIPTLNGYDSLEPKWYAQYVNLTWTPNTLLSQPRTFLDDYGVKYLVTNTPNPPYQVSGQALSVTHGTVNGTDAWKLVLRNGDDYLWENPDTIFAAWVSRSPNLVNARDKMAGSNAELASWTPNQQKWRATSPSSAIMVVSQTFDPNWSAEVDGKMVAVTRVDNTLTGVPIPSGSHVITLRFQPKSTTVGFTVSVFTLTLMLIWAIANWIRLDGRIRPKA